MLENCDIRSATEETTRKRRRVLYPIRAIASTEIAPSAIMRRDTRLAEFATLDSAGLAPTEQDSTGDDRWLPLAEEELENADLLEEERPARRGALLRGALTRGRFRLRRIAVLEERRGVRGELGFLVDGRHPRAGARATAAAGHLDLAAGRVTLSHGPALFAEAMRVGRSGRRVRGPRTDPVRAHPSLGASAGAIDGGAFTWNAGPTIWAFAGVRSEIREPIAGVGLGVSRGRMRGSAAFGAGLPARVGGNDAPDGGGGTAPRPFRCGSITVARQSQGRDWALEALRSPEGHALLAEARGRAGRALLSARWRFRSWKSRKVAAELGAETLGPDSRARVTWRSWSRNAAADDGLLELEASRSRRGAAALRLRVGAAGLGREGNRFTVHESYGLAVATLARDDRCSLAVHALRRGSSNAGSSSSSTTLGSRLDLRAGKLGRHSILVEATRIRKGAPAWGVGLAPSGETTLRARSKPGLWVSARGGFGSRLWRIGYALERGEGPGGTRPWSGSVWLKLDRSP